MLKKTRSVPACAKNLYSNVRFSLHVLRVFLNAVAKKLVDALFKSRGVPACVHVPKTCSPMYVLVCTCCKFFLTLR